MPSGIAVVVNQPRLLFGDITETLFVETVQTGVVIDLLQIPFEESKVKDLLPSPPLTLFLDYQRMHCPTSFLLRLPRVKDHHKIQLKRV